MKKTRFRPAVETLEAREVPAQITWVGGYTSLNPLIQAENDWEQPENWDGGVVPTIGDDVLINWVNPNPPANVYIPEVNDTRQVRSISSVFHEGFIRPKLDLDGGTLEIHGGMSNWDGERFGNGGPLDSWGNVYLIGGTFNWAYGAIGVENLVIQSGATLNAIRGASLLKARSVFVGSQFEAGTLGTLNVGSQAQADSLAGNILIEALSGVQYPAHIQVIGGGLLDFREGYAGAGLSGGFVWNGWSNFDTSSYGSLSYGSWIFLEGGELRRTGGVNPDDFVRVASRVLAQSTGRIFVTAGSSIKFEGTNYAVVPPPAFGEDPRVDNEPYRIFLWGGDIQLGGGASLRTTDQDDGIVVMEGGDIITLSEIGKIYGDVTMVGGSVVLSPDDTHLRILDIRGDLRAYLSSSLPGWDGWYPASLPEVALRFHLDGDMSAANDLLFADRVILSDSADVHFYGKTLDGPPLYGQAYTPILASFPGGLQGTIDGFHWDRSVQTYQVSYTGVALNLASTSSVIDNADPTGFSSSAGWQVLGDPVSYGGDYLYAVPSEGNEYASWDFVGIQNGTYQIFASWASDAANATDAVFKFYDGAVEEGGTFLDQTQDPASVLDLYGTDWGLLGYVDVSSGDLSVILESMISGYVVADAIMIVKVS